MARPKLAAARELIVEKKYIEARDLLLTMQDDPTAVKWLAQLEERMGVTRSASKSPSKNYTIVQQPRSVQQMSREELARNLMPPEDEPMPKEKTGAAGCFRFVWGGLFLLSLAWIAYGFLSLGAATGNQLNTAQARASQAYQAGTVIGGGIGLTFVLCTGVPLLVLFGILYWRNGVHIRETRRHNQMMTATRGRRW